MGYSFTSNSSCIRMFTLLPFQTNLSCHKLFLAMFFMAVVTLVTYNCVQRTCMFWCIVCLCFSEKSLSGHLTYNFHFSFPIYLATKGCLLQKCFYGRRMKNRVKKKTKLGIFVTLFLKKLSNWVVSSMFVEADIKCLVISCMGLLRKTNIGIYYRD